MRSMNSEDKENNAAASNVFGNGDPNTMPNLEKVRTFSHVL